MSPNIRNLISNGFPPKQASVNSWTTRHQGVLGKGTYSLQVFLFCFALDDLVPRPVWR